MTPRRWAVLFIGLVACVVIVVLSSGPTTWTVELHGKRTVPITQVGPDDRYVCEGVGVVEGTPDVGTAELGGNGSLYVGHNIDGYVSISCEHGVDWAMT